MAAGHGALTLTGTDLDLEAHVVVPAPGLADMSTTVPLAMLKAALKGAAGVVTFEQVGSARDSGVLKVTVDGATSALPIIPAGDFPIMVAPADTTAAHLTIGGAELVAGLRAVAPAISTEQTRYYLNGAFLTVAAEGVRLVSTDGSRLVAQDLPGAELVGALPAQHQGGASGVIIPRKSVQWLIRHAGAGLITMEINGAKIRASTGAARLTSRVIDGAFPDYGRVMPRADAVQSVLSVDSAAALPVLKRLIGQCVDRSTAVRFDVAGAVKMTVRNIDGGVFEALFPCAVSGAPIAFGVNGACFAQMLELGAKVEIKLEDSATPLLFEFPDIIGRVGVLMPLPG